MTDSDARSILVKYSTSSFFTDGGIPLATRTEPPTPAELVAGMAANVAAAKLMRDKVRHRFESAEADGLFDMDALATVSDRAKAAWVGAIDVMEGDRVRAVAELCHWREYYDWAVQKVRGAAGEREPGEEG